jgi:hypothetical protein
MQHVHPTVSLFAAPEKLTSLMESGVSTIAFTSNWGDPPKLGSYGEVLNLMRFVWAVGCKPPCRMPSNREPPSGTRVSLQNRSLFLPGALPPAPIHNCASRVVKSVGLMPDFCSGCG